MTSKLVEKVMREMAEEHVNYVYGDKLSSEMRNYEINKTMRFLELEGIRKWLERMEKLVNEQNKQNIHDLIELNKQLQENAVNSYKKGYNQALKDVEKLLDKLPEDAGLWLMEKIDNLKAKGQ